MWIFRIYHFDIQLKPPYDNMLSTQRVSKRLLPVPSVLIVSNSNGIDMPLGCIQPALHIQYLSFKERMKSLYIIKLFIR